MSFTAMDTTGSCETSTSSFRLGVRINNICDILQCFKKMPAVLDSSTMD
jgi:hypothetical protein